MRAKVFRLLSTLSTQEFRQFQRLVESPFFGGSESVKKYLAAIGPRWPDFDHTEEELLRELSPSMGVDSNRLRDLRRQLLRLLEEFLIQTQFQAQTKLKEKLLIESLVERELYSEALKLVEKEEQKHLAKPDISFATERYRLFLRRVFMDLGFKQAKRTKSQDLESPLASLDLIFIGERLKLLVAYENNNRIVERFGSYAGLLETLALGEKAGVMGHPLVAAYHLLLLLQTRGTDSKTLSDLYTLLESHAQAIPREELYNIFATLVNCFIVELRKGKAGSLQRAFRNYQRMHRMDLVMGMGKLSTDLIRNTVAAGARLGEWDWTHQFLEEVLPRIHDSSREWIEHFCRAQLAFHSQNYSQAKKHLLHVKFEDPMIKLSVNNILLKCYFEQQETEAFHSLIEASNKYLQRHTEIGRDFRGSFQNFLQFLGKLYRWRWEKTFSGSDQGLRNELEAYELFFNRDWAREQLLRRKADWN